MVKATRICTYNNQYVPTSFIIDFLYCAQIFLSAGEVEVAAASVGITEGGAFGSVCVVLTGTTGSPTELVNPLAVSVGSVLNAEAGRFLIVS